MTKTKKVVEITANDLGEMLMKVETNKGASIIASILQFTDAKALKKDRITKSPNPYQIYKLSRLSMLLNTEYEKGVLNQLERENKDESEYHKGVNTMPLEYGENNRFIGLYNGQFVLQYRPFDNSKPRVKYVDKATMKVVDKDKIVNFLPPVYSATNQCTDKEIFWRKVYLSNIRKLTFNGTIYKVIS